ncbi:hypothetical protein [Azospirillum sp. sgz302134]
MTGTADKARGELANLGNALTLAERGLPRHSIIDLIAWLLHAANLHPGAVSDSLLLEVCDVVCGTIAEDSEKIALIRMGWAAIVQAQYKRHGLVLVNGDGEIRACAA